MGIVALVLLAWQAARIPLEGSVETSLAHARSVRGLEESLGLDVEGPVIRFASTAPYDGHSRMDVHGHPHPGAVRLHGGGVRLRAGAVRKAAHDLRRLVLAGAPRDRPVSRSRHRTGSPSSASARRPSRASSPGSIDTLIHNSTAAIASQHFGFAVFIAAASLWLAPARPSPGLRWRTPPWCSSSSSEPATITSSTASSARSRSRSRRRSPGFLHGRSNPASLRLPARTVLSVSLGFAMIAWGLVSLQLISPGGWRNVVAVLVLAGGIAAVLAPRWSAKEPARREQRRTFPDRISPSSVVGLEVRMQTLSSCGRRARAA